MATRKKIPKGLIIIFTGNGKGKTSAALGVALRAGGYGYKTLMVKFIKGKKKYGEDFAVTKVPYINIISVGKGCYRILGDNLPSEKHKKAAWDGLQMAEKMLKSGKHDIVILDEVNVAISLGLLTFSQVKKLITSKPDHVHLILTGRNAPKGLVKIADLVTEMREIKHPFKKRILAIKGIDY